MSTTPTQKTALLLKIKLTIFLKELDQGFRRNQRLELSSFNEQLIVNSYTFGFFDRGAK